jgi:hypothetical protein
MDSQKVGPVILLNVELFCSDITPESGNFEKSI